MVISFTWHYPSSDSEEDVLGKAAVRTQKSKADAQKDSRRKQKLPSSQRKNGSRQPEKSSNRISDERATDGQKPERKSYTSSDLRNFTDVKDTLQLRIRLHCNCEGCINRVRETILKFKGIQRAAVKADKDMIKVIGSIERSIERKELVSYLEEKLRSNMLFLPIKDYDNVVDDSKNDEADKVPRTDCSPGISTTVQPTCQHSSDDDSVMQPLESSLPWDEQKVTNTVVLKIRQYCQEGCPQQTWKTVKKFQGVESVEIDVDESQVKVTGNMKVKELVSLLQKELKREVVLVSVEKTDKDITTKYKRLQQSGENKVGEASGVYGEEVKDDKVVGKKLYQAKNVPYVRDIRVPTVKKALNKSNCVSKDLENLVELKNGNADLSCPQHNSQYGSVGDKVHHMKVVKVGEKGMHREENVCDGRDARGHKASKKSKAVSRVNPVNLDEQTNVKPDLSQKDAWAGTMHHLENSMEGKIENKITSLVTFGLYCDEEYLEQTRETAMTFEGVELAKIDARAGLIMVTGAVDQRRLLLYLKENLKLDVLVVPIQRNDITGDVVQRAKKLKEDAVSCGGDGYRHKGAHEISMKVREVAACANLSGAWRKDKLGEAFSDIDSLYQQNYDVDSQFRWMSPTDRYLSPFSDENANSCSIM